MPPGLPVKQGHQRAKESLPSLPQPIGACKNIPNLMFPSLSPVKESGIFNFQEGNSSQNFLTMELKGPRNGCTENWVL